MNQRSNQRRNSRKAANTQAGSEVSTNRTKIPLDQMVVGGAAMLFVASSLQPTESAWVDGSTALHCLIWIVLLALWFGNRLLSPTSKISCNWVDVAVLGTVTWAMLATLVRLLAEDANSRSALNAGWQWPAVGASYLIFRHAFNSVLRQKQIVLVALGLSVFLGASGLYQFFYDLPRTRAEYQNAPESTKQQILRDARVPEVEPGSRMRMLFENRMASLEPMATFGLANSLACVLSTWLVFALGLTGLHYRPLLANRGLAAIWFAGIFVMAFCLMLTKSRTGYGALALGIILLIWFGRGRQLDRRRWILLNVTAVIGIALAAVAGIALQTLDVQVITEATKSFQYRLEYWQASLAMIIAAPVFGCGPGGFQDTYSLYKLPQASETVADPHNFLLEIAATCGIPAAVFFVGALTTIGWQLIKQSRQHASDDSTTSPQTPSSQSTSKQSNSASQNHWAANAIWIGALLGVPAAVLMGQSFGFQMNLGMLIVGCLISIPFVFAAAKILSTCQISPGLLGVTLAVLILNLSAAGGMTFLGVVQSCILLLALTVSSLPPLKWDWCNTQPANVIGLACGVILAIGLQQTLLLPVMTSRAGIAEAEFALQTRRFEQAEEALERAIEADPWAPDAWRLKAFVAFQRFQITSRPNFLATMAEALDEQIKRRPRTSQAYREMGDWYLVAFGRTQEVEYLERSIDAYQAAVDRYPNNGWYHAQLANSLAIANRGQLAREEAAEALRLDELTPHQDLKLANRPIRMPSGSFSSDSTEQIMRNLRNP